jgi:hypothetical protein
VNTHDMYSTCKYVVLIEIWMTFTFSWKCWNLYCTALKVHA